MLAARTPPRDAPATGPSVRAAKDTLRAHPHGPNGAARCREQPCRREYGPQPPPRRARPRQRPRAAGGLKYGYLLNARVFSALPPLPPPPTAPAAPTTTVGLQPDPKQRRFSFKTSRGVGTPKPFVLTVRTL